VLFLLEDAPMRAAARRLLTQAFLLSAVLLLTHAAVSQEPKAAKPLTAEQVAKLRECNQLWSAANKLVAAGKLDDALAAMEKAVTLHREALGRDDADDINPLQFIAEIQAARGDFAAARKRRQEAIDLAMRWYGKEHWQVADARRGLATVDRLEKMPAADRQQLASAWQTTIRVAYLAHEGKLAEAVALTEKAAAIRRQLLGENHADYAASLNNLAELYRRQADFSKAAPLWRQAIDIWKQALGENHPHYASGLYNLADLYVAQADYARAEPMARRALEIRKQVLGDKHTEYALSLMSLAFLYQQQGDYAQAEALYRQALEVRKQVLGERHPEYAGSLHALAGVYETRGDYARAEPLYRQALEIRKQVLGVKHPRYADSLGSLAGLATLQGDFAQAEPLFRQALEIRKQVQGTRHPDYAASLNNLAGLYQYQGDYAQAEPLYRQALEIYQQVLGDKHPNYANGLSNLAALYRSQRDYARAEPLCRQALEIYKQSVGDKHPRYATTLNLLGELYKYQGDYARAEPPLRQALELRKQVLGEKHPSYAVSLNQLADLYRIQGDYKRSEALYKQALEVSRQSLGEKHADYATGLSNLAELYLGQNDYARAEALYRQAVDIYRQSVGSKHPFYVVSLNNLAIAYMGQGNFAKAEPLFQQAQELGKEVLGDRHPEYAKSMHNLGRLRGAQGDHEQAATLLRQSVALTRDQLDLAAAAQSERQQLRMAESLRYQLDSYLSVSRAAGTQAYEPILSWKGAVTVRQQRLRLERRDPALAAQLRDVAGQLAALAFATPEPGQRDAYQQRILKLSERKEQLEKDLAQKSAGSQLARLSPEELQRALPAGTVLVDFLEYWHSTADIKTGRFAFERRLAAFVVPAAGKEGKAADIIQLDLGPVRPLREAIDQWRQSIGTRTRPVEKEGDPAALLRQKLWQPLEPHIKNAQTVLVSPDGVVARMPLAALPGSKPGTFLIEETALVVVPVPQLVTQTAVASASPKEALLLLGDVDYGAEAALADARSGTSRDAALPAGQRSKISWPRLPGSKTEVLAIRDSFRRYAPDGAVLVLQGAQATEAAVRREAPRHRYLHLATHGFFADPRLRSALLPEETSLLRTGQFGKEGFLGFHPGLLSGLVLAGANRPLQADHDDGILTALEVAELDLQNVELAVLSACETGLGETAGGEGVLGLQRAFQVAGARSVVTSLWKVDDEATAALMALFYHKLWQEKKPPLVALREAQLTLYHNPERVPTLAKERGPDFDKVVKLPATPPKEGKPTAKAPVKVWAAFVLSGTGK
jgi:tetratricopeptide (TPR) repeat protein